MYKSNEKNKFSIILAIAGAGLLILGLLFFSGRLGGFSKQKSEPSGAVVVWGTLDANKFNNVLGATILNTQNKIGVQYVEVSTSDLKNKLTEAIANDVSPDLIIADTTTLYSVKNFIQPLAYTTYPENNFRQTYIGITHSLLEGSGIFALPVLIDPVVLYYNREILANAGYANPPKTWTEVYQMAPDIIKIERGQIIRQELLPFGQYKNVSNAWAILSTLFLQSQVPIAKFDSVLGKDVNLNSSPISADAGQKAIEFFVQFSNPKSEFYTWNRSMLDSNREFAQGRLALLPNFASLAQDLRDRNPNINFAVAQMPQLNEGYQATFANVYGISMLKKSVNPTAAYVIWFEMAGADFTKALAQSFLMAPAQNNLIMVPPETTYLPTVYKSALIARDWYNNNQLLTDQAFGQMIDSIISGRQSIIEAIFEAESILKETK